MGKGFLWAYGIIELIHGITEALQSLDLSCIKVRQICGLVDVRGKAKGVVGGSPEVVTDLAALLRLRGREAIEFVTEQSSGFGEGRG